MSENKKLKYPLDEAIIAKAVACNKGMTCLEHGPACRIGAVLNRDILIVDCKDKDSTCPFYQLPVSTARGESRGHCTCPVRHALREKYGL